MSPFTRHPITYPQKLPLALLALGLWVMPALGQAAEPASATAALPPELRALLDSMQPKWSVTTSAHAGVGYKDNVLLSNTGVEGSGFARGGFDVFVWHPPRLSDGRVDYFGSVKAEATRFFSPQPVDHEADAYTWEEWRYRIGDAFKFALDAKGFYRDHVYDFSDTTLQRIAAPIKVTGGIVGPTVRWAPRSWVWLELNATGLREAYRDHFNNDDIVESAAMLGWKPSARFELSVGGTERHRKFDSRVQYSVGGLPDPAGQLLRIIEREGEARADVTWDTAGHWKTTTRVLTLHYTDNGSGYFNYHQRKAKQEVEWESGAWRVTLEGSARRLDFEVQDLAKIFPGLDPPKRVKEEFTAELRVERKLTDRWTAFAEYSWERSRCNDPIASYRMNEGLLGATWSWEK